MKKFVSVALVLCMVLALIPAMAFAAGDPVAMVGETPYSTVQAAIDAASAPDATTNRVDIVKDVPDCSIVVKSDIVIQLNGHILTGKTGTYGSYPVEIVGPNAGLTIQGPGTIQSVGGSDTTVVLANAGKLTLEKTAVVTGIIYNTGDVVKGNATLYGFFDNYGTVTVNDGGIYVPAGHAAFEGTGKATVNMGRVMGTLDTLESCAGLTVNGGVFDDKHVVKHTSSPVAGWYHEPSGNQAPGTYRVYSLSWWDEYWVGKTAMESEANVKKTGTVEFLYGDVAINGVPSVTSSTNPGTIYYYDGWDSYYTGTNKQALVGPDYYTGRGLVNGLSDFNIVASKATVLASDPIADGILSQNADLVKSVSAKYTGTNKNEVFVQIDITVDLKKATPFTVPEGYRYWGNNNGSHKWVPIALDFLNLDGLSIPKTGYEADKHWNLAFGYYPVDDQDPDTTYLWVGVDHNDLGENASFDFRDMRYGDHGLIYRCTIVVHDTDVDVPEVSQPDDKDNSETYPGDGKDKPATSATTAPAATGNGDGPAKTGDNSTVMLWATLLVASAAGVAICVVDEAKKRSRK